MAHSRTSTRRRIAAAFAVTGGVALGLLAVPAGAGAQPQLPPINADELVSSVLAAERPAYDGTVEVTNGLGLPALPNMPLAADGTSTARIWSNGPNESRIQLPTDGGERTLVSNGTTFWAWNSEDRMVVTGPREARPNTPQTTSDPSTAADDALSRLRQTSDIAMGAPLEVAGRPAYELLLTPKPTERTLLREIRIAVDAEKRAPLQVTVLGNGSTDPALQVGFTELGYGPQDPALFTFTPPPGATVQQRPPRQPAGSADRTVVGDGWDTVVVRQRSTPDQRPPGAPDPATLGTPVTGPWGNGRLIRSTVGNAILTDDGRMAAGAVPEQLLDEALSR